MNSLAGTVPQQTSTKTPDPHPWSFDTLLRRGAADWRLPERTVLLMALIPILVCGTGVVTALLGPAAYIWFTTEDGVAENLQVAFFAGSFVLCALAARRAVRHDERWIAALYGVGLVGLFFVIGEEISWGQRLLGWGTPEWWQPLNKQQETNIHNLNSLDLIFQTAQLGAGAYGTFLPVLFVSQSFATRFRRYVAWLVPHYTLVFFFAPLFVWRVYRNALDPPDGFYFVVSEFSEVIELNLTIGLVCFMWYQLRRQLAAPELAAPQTEEG